MSLDLILTYAPLALLAITGIAHRLGYELPILTALLKLLQPAKPGEPVDADRPLLDALKRRLDQLRKKEEEAKVDAELAKIKDLL